MSGDMSGDEQVRAWKDPDAPGDGTRAHPAGEFALRLYREERRPA